MAVRFSDEQVLRATGARRARIGPRASYGAVCTDTRAIEPGSLFVALIGERYDGHQFLGQAAAGGAVGAVVKRGHPHPPLPADFGLFEVEDTLQALGALSRFHRTRFNFPVGAITGSNGKTTTKEMVAAILETRGPVLKTQGNLNNEVGVPLTLFGLSPAQVGAVIEMGMNRPGEISRLVEMAQPTAGLITSVQAAHLHGLGSLEAVAAAKGELFEGLSADAVAVVNLDDLRVAAQAERARGPKLTYGRAEAAQVRLKQVVSLGHEGQRVTVRYAELEHHLRLRFVGEHNAHNAAGAFALGLALGWSAAECVQGLEAARPFDRRLTLKPGHNGVWVLDDCYNANPASMEAALETVRQLSGAHRAIAVLGDMLELGTSEQAEHRRLGELAARQAQVVAFFGPRTGEAHLAAQSIGPPSAHFTDVEPLVAWLKPQLQSGDVVLVKGSRGMRLERVVEALIAGRPSEGP